MADALDEKAVGSVIWEGPALLTNKMFVVVLGTTIRITFTEQPGPDMLPVFRTAVAMNIHDAIGLSNVLRDTLTQLENMMKGQPATTEQVRG